MAAKGKVWELTLMRWHKRYWAERKARIRKCNPEAKLSRGRMFYSATGPPDFMGTIAPRTPVCFDAKECAADKFYPSKVEAHQLEELKAQHEMGAIAFLCVRFTKLDKNVVYRYPFPDKKGLAPEDGLIFGANGWLEVV